MTSFTQVIGENENLYYNKGRSFNHTLITIIVHVAVLVQIKLTTTHFKASEAIYKIIFYQLISRYLYKQLLVLVYKSLHEEETVPPQ